MRFASLGSGSRGNALVVEVGQNRVLVDCGFGPRNLTKRLALRGLLPSDIDAVLVTHEHSDHVGGVMACARQFGFAVHMTHGTFAAIRNGHEDVRDEDVALNLFESHTEFSIGDLSAYPFPVPHDAREPVQFVLSDGNLRLGVLTDIGFATSHMVEMLKACDALVLECNHDEAMLANGDYPFSLKQRVGGRYGHLSNAAAAKLLAQLDFGRLQHLVAAHLSEQNNTAILARAALAEVMGCKPDWIGVASQEEGFDWREVE